MLQEILADTDAGILNRKLVNGMIVWKLFLLNAIFGYTALAKKYLDDASMVDSYLDKINVAGRQLLDMPG